MAWARTRLAGCLCRTRQPKSPCGLHAAHQMWGRGRKDISEPDGRKNSSCQFCPCFLPLSLLPFPTGEAGCVNQGSLRHGGENWQGSEWWLSSATSPVQRALFCILSSLETRVLVIGGCLPDNQPGIWLTLHQLLTLLGSEQSVCGEGMSVQWDSMWFLCRADAA